MNGSRIGLPALVTLASVSIVGCSDGRVSIGDTDSGTPTKTGLAVFTGQWNGYIQAHTFVDGSDRVRMTIAENGTGTLRFGNTELYPKPTDPNVKFPPSFPLCLAVCTTIDFPEVFDGFAYALNSLHGDGGRLQATVGSSEVFKDWCELQPAHHYYESVNNQDVYSCSTCPVGGQTQALSDDCNVWGTEACAEGLANGFFGDSPNPPVRGLCEREMLCGSREVCQCDVNGCGLAAPRQDVIFDATLSSDNVTIMGTLVLSATNYTVVLKRQ